MNRGVVRHSVLRLLPLLLAAVFAGCGRPATEPTEAPPDRVEVVLQTDWYPQPEHGGFYQALAKGYYAEEGLDVTILPGGPNANTIERVALGEAHFSLGRSETIIAAIARGVPLVMAGTLMQKDPLAIMYHRESGIEGFEDLDGRALMANPGLVYLEVLRRKYGIDFRVIPMDFGLQRFIADKDFVQQVFVTNEPYFVRQQGLDPGLLMMSDSGFEPYQVWYTSRNFLRRHPDVVGAFGRASIRGWKDFLAGDRSAALELIAERNPRMTSDFMEHSVAVMIDRNIVTGADEETDRVGLFDRDRIERQIEQLAELGLIENRPAPAAVVAPGAWSTNPGNQ